jgi:tRNA nucleotidyltransferase (CCA-adding enzyme)
MEMENLRVIFALAQMEDKIYLVARSRVADVNVAEIALAFGGGGHPQAASATIKNKTLIQVERSLQALLRSRINPQKKARDMMSSPAIHIHPHESIKEAATIMTKYNINVLVVIDNKDHLSGYITRHVHIRHTASGHQIYFILHLCKSENDPQVFHFHELMDQNRSHEYPRGRTCNT